MRISLTVFSLLLLPIFFGACRKCKSDRIDKRFINENAKVFFNLGNVGSYWIYQNQDKSKSDSLYVTDYSYTWQKDHITCMETETIRSTFKSKNKNIILALTDSVCMEITNSTIDLSHCPNSQFLGWLTGLEIAGDSIEFCNFNCKAKSIDSIRLNGIEYKDDLQDLTRGEGTNLFLQKNIGIIGWITPTDTFNLIKSNIIP
jgi:hypothetical protein